MTQLFQNLIENAIKYGGTGSTVRVSAKVVENIASISVIDEGDGIAREHIPRLTERFYRVDTARSRELGGTGLGLAIVKHIANRHRGELTIHSEPGIGSTFTDHAGPDTRTKNLGLRHWKRSAGGPPPVLSQPVSRN